jgi:acyl-homoserine lactone acylase PvdQ
MLNSNRACYVTIVVLGKKQTSESIMSLGQSGFIKLGPTGGPELDAHFNDQFGLFKNFEYRPMKFYRNRKLKE